MQSTERSARAHGTGAHLMDTLPGTHKRASEPHHTAGVVCWIIVHPLSIAASMFEIIHYTIKTSGHSLSPACHAVMNIGKKADKTAARSGIACDASPNI